jgi:hypothetical protein
MFITKDSPIRTPSAKSVSEKPAYSKYKKRPIRMPRARDIAPTAKILSSLSCIFITLVCQVFLLVTIRFSPVEEATNTKLSNYVLAVGVFEVNT